MTEAEERALAKMVGKRGWQDVAFHYRSGRQALYHYIQDGYRLCDRRARYYGPLIPVPDGTYSCPRCLKRAPSATAYLPGRTQQPPTYPHP